jgi:hypothetical protein
VQVTEGAAPMFYFHLRKGQSVVADDEGEDLPGAWAARTHAVRVARELMRGRELQTRHYRLDVIDERGGVVTEVPFAAVDPTLSHLRGDLRELIVRLSQTRREFCETLAEADQLMLELRAMRARSQGGPYLITSDGHRV